MNKWDRGIFYLLVMDITDSFLRKNLNTMHFIWLKPRLLNDH